MDIEKNKDVMIFKLSGEINLYNEKQIKEELTNKLEEGISSVIVDMNKVEFVDSSGIGMLIYLNKYIKTKGKIFSIRAVPPDVLKILKLGMIDKIINIIKQ
jgi:anti-sigma B factor antagonist